MCHNVKKEKKEQKKMKNNYNDDDKTLRYLKQTILEKNHREKVKFFSFTFSPQKKKLQENGNIFNRKKRKKKKRKPFCGK